MAPASLQHDYLQVIGYKDLSVIDTLSLTCIEFFSRIERFLLGMIEDEMSCAEFLRIACSVESRTMVLLIGFEALAVGIQAEGLTHQPISVRGIRTARIIEGLVAQTDELTAIGKEGRETKLFFFGRVDIETLQPHVAHLKAVAVLKFVEDDAIRHLVCLFLGQ